MQVVGYEPRYDGPAAILIAEEGTVRPEPLPHGTKLAYGLGERHCAGTVEDDGDHEQSMALLREVRPEKINVTRFSKRPGTDAAEMKGLGGQMKKDRSKAMSALKMDVVGDAYQSMVGERHEVLVVEQGTGDSVKCRDGAYRQLIIQNASEHGVEPGEFLTVEVTSAQSVYAFASPVGADDPEASDEEIAVAD